MNTVELIEDALGHLDPSATATQLIALLKERGLSVLFTPPSQPRTAFAEELSADRFIKIVIYGEWGDDMKEAVESFLGRRKIQQTPGA